MRISEEEDKLFAELRTANSDIVDDGVISEKEYLAAKYKIMYVLKEVNGGKGWSLREFVRESGRAQTWDNIARWTEAILNLDSERTWEYWENGNEDRRKKILKKICVVNVKKTSGGHTSNAMKFIGLPWTIVPFFKNSYNYIIRILLSVVAQKGHLLMPVIKTGS